MIEGRIDGFYYEGECACLVGTISKIKNINYTKIDSIIPDDTRPIERWFLAIKQGETPSNSPFSKIILEWIDEFSMM